LFKRIADLRTEDNIENNILLRGWIHRLRKQKEKTFIILRDDRGDIIQAVCPSNLCEDLTIESSIQIQGKLEKDPRAVEGGYEVKVDNIMVFNIANVDYPIGEYQSNEILLDFRHLSL
jgi:asparaginyl-tRNA synthetase